MAGSKNFSISRKGYNPAEVDEYIAESEMSAAELRESYASLQTKYDSLFEENGKLIKEREQLRQGCKTMAAALKQFRENSDNQPVESSDDEYKAKYEETAAQLKDALAQIEELKSQKAEAPIVVEPASASQMIEEVAQVVKRVESDARRKAEAVTAAAKLEQAKAELIHSRVNDEVKSLIQMLESYLDEHEEI